MFGWWIVDAIFGTGLRSPLNGMLETVVADVNDLPVPVVAIDLPTGLSADTHETGSDAIVAAMTVTLAALVSPRWLLKSVLKWAFPTSPYSRLVPRTGAGQKMRCLF